MADHKFYRRLSLEEKILIVDLRNQGLTYAKIAQKLNRPAATIMAYMKRREKQKEVNQKNQDPVLVLSSDPRSRVCQQIRVCYHSRCHLHSRCPAYQNK